MYVRTVYPGGRLARKFEFGSPPQVIEGTPVATVGGAIDELAVDFERRQMFDRDGPPFNFVPRNSRPRLLKTCATPV